MWWSFSPSVTQMLLDRESTSWEQCWNCIENQINSSCGKQTNKQTNKKQTTTTKKQKNKEIKDTATDKTDEETKIQTNIELLLSPGRSSVAVLFLSFIRSQKSVKSRKRLQQIGVVFSNRNNVDNRHYCMTSWWRGKLCAAHFISFGQCNSDGCTITAGKNAKALTLFITFEPWWFLLSCNSTCFK